MSTLVEFDLCEKLFCTTTDNASNNSTMMEHLFASIDLETGFKYVQADQHIPCLAHVINLTVGAFLKGLKVICDEDALGDDESIQDRITYGSEKDFTLTMLKVREIYKVSPHTLL